MSLLLPVYGGETHFIEHLQKIARILSGDLVDHEGRVTPATESVMYFTSRTWGLILKELQEKYSSAVTPALATDILRGRMNQLRIGKVTFRNARTDDQRMVDTMNALSEDKSHYMWRKEHARKV